MELSCSEEAVPPRGAEASIAPGASVELGAGRCLGKEEPTERLVARRAGGTDWGLEEMGRLSPTGLCSVLGCEQAGWRARVKPAVFRA